MRAGLMLGALLLPEPVQASDPAACRSARDALRSGAMRFVERQTIREACGRSEQPLQAIVGEIEALAIQRLALMDPTLPEEAWRNEFRTLRTRTARDYGARGATPVTREICAREEPLETRLAALRQARDVLRREMEPGRSLDCRLDGRR
jgi:hypothetical protein